MAHSINKGYFSGKYVLRVWGRDGETLHNSIHDTPDQARAAFIEYEAAKKWPRNIDVEKLINDLPRISVEQGFTRRMGHPTPNDPDPVSPAVRVEP